MTARRPYKPWVRCAVCNEPANPSDPMTRGHIIPKSLGGPDAAWNIRPEHSSCNQARGNSYTREDVAEAMARLHDYRRPGPPSEWWGKWFHSFSATRM